MANRAQLKMLAAKLAAQTAPPAPTRTAWMDASVGEVKVDVLRVVSGYATVCDQFRGQTRTVRVETLRFIP